MTKKILLLDGVHDRAREVLESAGFEVERQGPLAGDELREALASVQGVVVRSATKVTAEALAGNDSLEVIGRAGAGVDNIDLGAAKDGEVKVVNAPGTNANAVAELVIGHMLCLARHFPRADAGTRAGDWPKKALAGVELKGKSIGVIGAGRIGGRVLELATAFGMTPVAMEPSSNKEYGLKLGWKFVDLDTLIATCDVISVHAPKTPETVGLINAEMLAKFKPGSWLINCARGELVDTDAVVAALQDPEAPLAAAALDVFDQEPLPAGHALYSLDNVVLTPHLGASSEEAQILAAEVVAEQVVGVLKGGEVAHVVSA